MLFPTGGIESRQTLKGTWSRPPIRLLFFGSRTIEPKSVSVVLKKDDHIQSVEFEARATSPAIGDNPKRGGRQGQSSVGAAKSKSVASYLVKSGRGGSAASPEYLSCTQISRYSTCRKHSDDPLVDLSWRMPARAQRSFSGPRLRWWGGSRHSFCRLLRSLGAIWTWKISPNAFERYASTRSFKHTRMPACRASVRRGVGKPPLTR